METVIKMTETEYNTLLDKAFGDEAGVIFIDNDFTNAEKADILEDLISYEWPQIFITNSGSGIIFFSKMKLKEDITSALADLVIDGLDGGNNEYLISEKAVNLLKLRF